MAEKDGLVIYPSLLPCTVALEFDAEVPEGALLRSKHCYGDLASRIEDHTGTAPAPACFVCSCVVFFMTFWDRHLIWNDAEGREL